MKKVLHFIKKYWTRIWLIAVALLLAGGGIAVTFAAYTEVSAVKRVVSTTDSEGELFSSNCMRQDVSSRMITSRNYSVTVCNYDQDKPLTFNPAEVAYTFYAELQVKYENGEYLTMSELLTQLQTDYPSDYATKYAAYTTKIGENYAVRKEEDDSRTEVSIADSAPHYFTADNNYTVSFSGQTLAPNKSSTDKFQVTVAPGDLLQTNPDFYVHVWAQPTGYSKIESRIFGAQPTENAASWQGTLRETDNQTVDYDFYNYIITGNGAGTIDIIWDPEYFEINEFFYSARSGNSFVQSPAVPEKITASHATYGSKAGCMMLTLNVDSVNGKNRYEVQLYKKKPHTSYTGEKKASNYIECHFTESE